MIKVYLIYARLTEEEYQSIFNWLYRANYKTDSQGYRVGLYAWTKSEKKLKAFKKTRPDKFVYKEMKISKEEYPSFRTENIIYRLDYYNYHYNTENVEDINEEDNVISILTTKNEFVTASEDNAAYAINEMLIECTVIDYEIFTDPVKNLLDKIGYTYNHDNLYGDEESRDLVSQYYGFGITPLGNKYVNPFDNINEINTLMILFKAVMM